MKNTRLNFGSQTQKMTRSKNCFLVAALAVLLGSVLPTYSQDETAPVFGPKKYTRDSGPPDRFTETFMQEISEVAEAMRSCSIFMAHGPRGR